VFAGAVRETVFSRADIVRRINDQFVPVALKAALVNNPPAGMEGAFLAEISRSKPAPQGVCVANGAGKVLAWALSFDDNAQVPKFLDYTLARHKQFPDAAKPVPTQRFMRFPGQPMAEVADTRARLPRLSPHGKNEFCPATPPKARGTLVARVWGRRVEKNGRLCESCISQENYIEDIFDVPNEMQREIARLANDGQRFRLPENFVRHLATYTYLGQLDVRPVSPPVPQHRAREHALEWWAAPAPSSVKGSQRWRITGKSDVESSHPGRGDGAHYHHRVTLDWRGFIDLRGKAILKLGLWAEGQEQLQWGNPRLRLVKEPDVAHLMAGRFIDFNSPVRYGIIGAPVAGKNVWQGKGPPPQSPGPLGGPGPALEQKMQRLQQGLRRLAQTGGNPRPVQKEIMAFQRLMQQGRRAEAEQHLNRALALVGVNPPRLPRDLEEKLQRVRAEVERLLRDGKKAEADRLFDNLLRELKKP
jgi:hypothetical protein